MNEPTRLRDSTDPTGAYGGELLRAARAPRPMPADVRARSAARVAAFAATPLAVGAVAKWWSGKTIAWLLGFGVLGAAVGIGAYGMRGGSGGVVYESPQTGGAGTGASASASASAGAGASASAGAGAGAGASASSSPSPTLAAPKPSADTLAEENALLDPIRGKLDADPSGVLVAADAHRKKFPAGQLAADREYLAVRALKKLGRGDDAKKRGEAFLARYPNSPYAMYVRKLIE